MKVTFWGVRGSIPAPISSAEIEGKITAALAGAKDVDLSDKRAIREYVLELPPLVRGTVGGNTPCVSIEVGDEWIILDAGSGIRPLGVELLKREFGQGQGTAHILISHTHWDHIQGIPFFDPFFVPGNRISIYSPISDLEERLEGQQAPEYFPITMGHLRAEVSFVQLRENIPAMIAGVQVRTIIQPHPGRSYGYRLDGDGASIVYASDAEYKNLGEAHTQRYVEFMSGTDLLIFDAQYTLSEAFERFDWGHSSSMIGVDMAVRANVKRLVLFHFAPAYTDQQVQEILKRTQNYMSSDPAQPRCEVHLAAEGLQFQIGGQQQALLSRRQVGDIAVLSVSGRFDASVVGAIDERLTALISDNPKPKIVFDMSLVTHLSVAGLKTLLNAQQLGQDTTLVLAGAPPNVRQVLAQVGFAEAFVQYDTVQDALAAYEAQEYLQLQGHTLRGRYLIQKNLYVGQKAAVFKAFDTWFERPVTIKVVPQSAGRQARQMLLREARAVARMNHPNIASVHDCLEHGDRLFLIREFVDGHTLRQRLSELEAGRLLLPKQVLTIAHDILEALAYAHELGVVHHYLQPKNIMIAGEQSKIINFGLVEMSDEEWSLNDVSYMAPEQLAHETSTVRADLYAVGAILYELVTGRPPFLADSVAQLIQLCLKGQIAPPRALNPSLPAPLEGIILRLLETDPGRRYASAREVLDALHQVGTWDA